MATILKMIAEVGELGFAMAPGLFDQAEISRLIEYLPQLKGAAGTRNLLTFAWCHDLANDSRLAELVHALIGENANPVRGILFDKSDDANWALAWHQDTKIAVSQRIEAPGYTGWSEKEGVIHCQPPASILESSIAVRIHLDPCGTDNGPLRVIPESHLSGIQSGLTNDQLTEAVECIADPGDVLLMKPLLWHASGKSATPSQHRRVIHIEYCAAALPEGLEWAFS